MHTHRPIKKKHTEGRRQKGLLKGRGGLRENLGLWRWVIQLLQVRPQRNLGGMGRRDQPHAHRAARVLVQALLTCSGLLLLWSSPEPPKLSRALRLSCERLLQRALPASPVFPGPILYTEHHSLTQCITQFQLSCCSPVTSCVLLVSPP